jgi:hypothetical protein
VPKNPNDIAPEIPELQQDREQYRGPDDLAEANEDDDEMFEDDMDSSESDQDGIEDSDRE